MKQRIIPSLILIICGAVAMATLERQYGCAGILHPTTQQTQTADQLVATAQAQLDTAQEMLRQLQKSASTQPANPQLAAEIVKLQTRVIPQVQKGVDYAVAGDQLVYHDNPNPAIGAISAIAGPYGPLIGVGLAVAWGFWQKTKRDQQNVATSQALADNQGLIDQGQAALQQYAQAVHAVAPDAVVHQVNQLVDSSTRAAVADAGVIHVPDAVPTAIPGTFGLTLRPASNVAGI